jgi:hypothetical protein
LFVVREKSTVQFPRVGRNESARSSGINTVTHEKTTTRGTVSAKSAREYNTNNEKEENQKREGMGSRNNLLRSEQQKPTKITRRRVDGSAAAGSPDWRAALIACIKDLRGSRNRKVYHHILKFMLIDDDLYRRTIDGLLLMCLSDEQARIAIGEVHKGICGSHQSAFKMKWMLRRACLYWPTMVNDCVKYQMGCEVCQRFGNVQFAPASMLHPIIKPWPFRGWGLDFIGEVHTASSKGHKFILVATDYFTKWTEAVPLRNMTHREVINFVQEHIIQWFGVPQSLTTDQGSSFMSHQFKEFAGTMKIKLLNSSPYYAKTNGQAESSNKTPH